MSYLQGIRRLKSVKRLSIHMGEAQNRDDLLPLITEFTTLQSLRLHGGLHGGLNEWPLGVPLTKLR